MTPVSHSASGGNLAAYFLDHNLPTRRDKVALRYRDEAWTFGEMAEGSCRYGTHLRALGVREEDRVLLALEDTPDFVMAWFGVVRIGAVVAMMNPGVPEKDWSYYLRYTRARVLVTTSAFADANAAAIEEALGRQLSAVIRVDADREALRARSAECPYGDTGPDDPAVWLFSSGSTGAPKACVHAAGDFIFNTERYAKQVLGIREDDVTLGVPKLFFGYATGTNLMFPWAVGATTCLYSERATVEEVIANIERYHPTIVTNVPTMIHRMLEHPRCDTMDLSSIRLVLSAGEALPAELYTRWMRRTGVEILDGIGSAELFHIYITNYPGDVRVGTLGKLVPGYEAKIVGDDERAVPVGEIGTLWVKGASNAICYHQDRAKSRETYRGEWTTTGDQFCQDAEGYFVYCGRADDLLKVGGVFVSPVEVENCLLTHPSVRECAIVGVEREGLTTTVAFVVATGEGDEALGRALQEHVKSRLAPHKYPRSVRFLDVLPRNDRGKVARAELKRLCG
ncbi:MAG: benzoate-CoA ligase family protein [Pseudomonadota bacterium]|nr:benzoate-CoA ligase family protein [Pseudomonadota bacterium]